jgi:hypothetical protein
MIISEVNIAHTTTNAPITCQGFVFTSAHGEAANPSVMRSMRTLVLGC